MTSKFSFEGDVASLSPRQQEFLCNVLEKRGHKVNKVQIDPVGKPGDNYVASVKRITVHTNDSDTFRMIAKIAPVQESHRAMMNAAPLFRNEIFMYNEVFPKLTELQISADVPEEECLQYAECYGVLTEEPYELILLEDLQVSNFHMLDRFVPLTNESVKLILKNFALLHSLSFVLKKKEPEMFEYFSTKLLDYYGFLNTHPIFQQYMIDLENDTLALLDKEVFKKAVRNIVSQFGANLNKNTKMEATSRYTVIVQGDGWTNNVMFRSEDNELVEATMIDYQASRVTSPAADLLYMIFNCTDHSTRLNHYYDWIEYYHSVLDKSLSNYGLKANYVYPRDQLDADLRRYSKTFFAYVVMTTSMLIRSSEDATKVKEAIEAGDSPSNLQGSNLNPASVVVFKDRIEGIINSYREFGYIN